MNQLSEFSKRILLDVNTPSVGTVKVVKSLETSPFDFESLKRTENFINSYSYERCHEMTYWILDEIPNLKAAAFHGTHSNRPAHSAILLPSGMLFDAQGIRSVETVFNEYNKITLNSRNETIKPARYLSREELFDVMIDVTKSFHTRADVEASFSKRKEHNLFEKINLLLGYSASYLAQKGNLVL
ncbi:hypothetical protein V4T45_004069 [Vibrio vulnificus]|uniref:hypothetical protein n=1 Tax=Vibrio vulnificus TaxID=672 RepID=UPI002879123C|nr:hypothetical protein [Vibrio vulnificus]EJP4178239.1 hypothetical protein [Vibrio vulnificus]ELR8704477.1 hypothetical protein [Vibrio vulnificus]ELR8772709.1 hypothetical protein [Vibrio vulnificus]MDS1842160.1 hypothetical protein [Vibrio vulnificus]MDS1850744.1 hypothetical protein [Vibrio vulnificus]